MAMMNLPIAKLRPQDSFKIVQERAGFGANSLQHNKLAMNVLKRNRSRSPGEAERGLDGAADLGRDLGRDLKMKARSRAQFWEETEDQLNDRIGLEDSKPMRKRKELQAGKERDKLKMKRQELDRLKQEQRLLEQDKDTIKEAMDKEQAKANWHKLKDFLHETTGGIKNDEHENAMKNARALPLSSKELRTDRGFINALHRSNLHLQSQQTIFKYIKQNIESANLKQYMQHIGNHTEKYEPWHKEANECLQKLEDEVTKFCIKNAKNPGTTFCASDSSICVTRSIDTSDMTHSYV